MAFGSGHAAGGLSADINVTPLIDVLLVLLITFMVIMPVPPRGLDAQMPLRSGHPKQNEDAAIVVQILKAHNGRISYRINQDDLGLTELSSRLKAVLSLRANRVMFIKGDANLGFSTVAQVLDIGKGAGADHIGLLTPKNGF